jgi:hypothetical protein
MKSVATTPVEEWTEEQLVKIMEGYKAKNIYNTDETRL